MVKPIIRSAGIQLTYPLYCCDFVDPDRLVVAGGGGPGRHGVGNKMVRTRASLSPSLRHTLTLSLCVRLTVSVCPSVSLTLPLSVSSCPVLSCLVLSCRLLSCWSCLVLSPFPRTVCLSVLCLLSSVFRPRPPHRRYKKGGRRSWGGPA